MAGKRADSERKCSVERFYHKHSKEAQVVTATNEMSSIVFGITDFTPLT